MTSVSSATILSEESQPSGWRPLLRAASLTGAAAVASAALSVAATKIFAAMLGPAEVAVLTTLQQIRQAGVTGATLNGQTALVQGISSRNGAERRQFLRTALVLMTTATLVVTALALGAPGWLASSTGLGVHHAGLIRWLAVPVVFSSALVFLSAVLTARGEIGRLAVVQMASPAAMAILAYPVTRLLRGGRQDALVGWLAASAGVAVILALALLNRDSVKLWFRGPGRWWSAQAARRFLTMSGAMLAGGAAAALVLLAARARILHQQGFAVTGQFDAAWAISMNHVSLVLASLQTFCLPLLARTPDRAERNAQVDPYANGGGAGNRGCRLCAGAAEAGCAGAVLFECIPRGHALFALDAGGRLPESLELGTVDSDACLGRYARVPDGGSQRVCGFCGGSDHPRPLPGSSRRHGDGFRGHARGPSGDLRIDRLAVLRIPAGPENRPDLDRGLTGGGNRLGSDVEGGMRVSVAIATYNRAAMVCEAIEAALDQTHPPDEIVVADDASTDSTWATLNDISAGEPRGFASSSARRIRAA